MVVQCGEMMGLCGFVVGKTESMWVIRDAGEGAGTTNTGITSSNRQL